MHVNEKAIKLNAIILLLFVLLNVGIENLRSEDLIDKLGYFSI